MSFPFFLIYNHSGCNSDRMNIVKDWLNKLKTPGTKKEKESESKLNLKTLHKPIRHSLICWIERVHSFIYLSYISNLNQCIHLHIERTNECKGQYRLVFCDMVHTLLSPPGCCIPHLSAYACFYTFYCSLSCPSLNISFSLVRFLSLCLLWTCTHLFASY